MRLLTSVGCLLVAVYQIFWPTSASCLDVAIEAPPQVVVSIQPICHLVEAVMEGVARPVLLLPPNSSPHHYALKPSERKILEEATLFFWVGPTLEHFLVRTVRNLEQKGTGRIVQLDKATGLDLLPLSQDSCPLHPHATLQVKEPPTLAMTTPEAYDPHFWLDPKRAIVLTQMIVHHLSAKDPRHQSQYAENGAGLIQQLERLDKALLKRTAALQGTPYFVFHNGYRYFEQRYRLNSQGALTAHPEMPLSIERFHAVKERIKHASAHCLFKEPQFQPRWLEALAKEMNVTLGTLDPMGIDTGLGFTGYAQLFYRMTNALEDCLGKAKDTNEDLLRKLTEPPNLQPLNPEIIHDSSDAIQALVTPLLTAHIKNMR